MIQGQTTFFSGVEFLGKHKILKETLRDGGA